MAQERVDGVDRVDRRILAALQREGRATLTSVAERVGLSVSAVQARVRKLEDRGVIAGYRAVVDYAAVGLPIAAFVDVTLLDYARELEMPKALARIEGVVSCYSVTGAPNYRLGVRAASPEALERLLNRIHRELPVTTRTTLVLQAYFEHQPLAEGR